MQPDSIQSITIPDGKVYFSSCPGSSTSSNFFPHEAMDYMKRLRKYGIESVLTAVARYALNGEYNIKNGSLWCRLFNQGYAHLRHTHRLSRTLPADTADAFMEHFAVQKRSDPAYDPADEFQHLVAKYRRKRNVFVADDVHQSLDDWIKDARQKLDVSPSFSPVHTASRSSFHSSTKQASTHFR